MPTPFESIIPCVSTLLEIQGNDCIGDTREAINNNVQNLGTAICNLSGNLTTSVNSLNTAINNTSTSLNTTIANTSGTLNSLLNTLSSIVSGINTSFNTSNIGLSATLTTYVSSLSVFHPNGTYIGFIPIYI